MNEAIDEKTVRKLFQHTYEQRDETNCFPWTEPLQDFVATSLGKDDPCGFIELLIQKGILEEPILGKLRFVDVEFFIGEKTMSEEKVEGSDKKPSKENDASKQDASKKAGTPIQATLTDAKEVISDGSDFKLPLLGVFLKGEREKVAVLKGARIATGQFGPFVVLDLEALQ